MKNVLMAILLTFVIASCSSSTGNDNSFKAYQSGEWTIVSKQKADYDGIRAKSKVNIHTLASYSRTPVDTTEKGEQIYTSEQTERTRMYMKFYKNEPVKDYPDSLDRKNRARIVYSDSLLNYEFFQDHNLTYNTEASNDKYIETGVNYAENEGSFLVDIPVSCTEQPISFDQNYLDIEINANKGYENPPSVIVKLRLGDITQPIKDLCREQGLL